MVYNFVRTHDCFRDARPNVETNISYTRIGDELQVVAEILWQRPHVLFPHLTATLQPGAEFTIAPEHAPTIGATSGFPQFPEHTELTAHSSALTWDPRKECFRTVVPSNESWQTDCTSLSKAQRTTPYSQHSVRRICRAMESILTVKSTLLFPGSVRHERTSRYNIRLDIREPQVPRPVLHTSRTSDAWWCTTPVRSSRKTARPQYKTTGTDTPVVSFADFVPQRLGLLANCDPSPVSRQAH